MRQSGKSSNVGGASDTYTYEQLNRLSTATDASGSTTYAYDAVGNLQNFTYPNGVTHAYSYDTLNRLTQVGAAKNADSISNYAYTLGAAGNRLTVAELSGRTVNYGYDSLYRLTSEAVTNDPNSHDGTTSYQYDNVGNRKQLLINGTTANTYTYDADDRLGSDGYDANGNTINSGGTADSYDFENHLTQHGFVTLVYDGDGNRVSETVGGLTTNYLVDTINPTGYAQVVDELLSSAVTRTYAYGLERIDEDQIISSAWTPSFYGYDGHGSVRQLTNAAGAATDSYDYDAFGNIASQTGSTPNNYLFDGEQYDPALGLYYNRARYLNTTTGRFWGMDSFEGDDNDPPSLHKYSYTENNPVNDTDTDGNEIDEIGGALSVMDTLNAIPIPNINTIISSVKPETLYIRDFARWKVFGLRYAGDDRGFTTTLQQQPCDGTSPTSRIQGSVQFMPSSGSIFGAPIVCSDLSRDVKTGKTARATPTISATSDAGKMHVEIEGSNPLVAFAPDIDVNLSLAIQEKGGQVCYDGKLTGTAFPDVEVFVVNRSNQGTMLDTYATSGGPTTGPLRLFLPGIVPMGSFSKCTPE